MADIRVAVITGNHPYDIVPFHQLFRSLDGFDCYVQHLEDWATTAVEERQSYRVTVFYHMTQETPDPSQSKKLGKTRAAVDSLLDSGQGVLLLHHALLAWPQWDVWSGVTGINNREFDYHHEQKVLLEPVPDHPITEGLSSWEMMDETYTMDEPEGVDVLLRTKHTPSMHTLGWAREDGSRRVVCLQSGHDERCWENLLFRMLLTQSIRWLAREEDLT